jgi:hypothetical protein
MDTTLLETIRSEWQPQSPRAGRIVHYYCGIWHYSVALSDSSAVSWGPHKTGMWGSGRLTVHLINPACRDVTNVHYLALAEIYQNVLASVVAFHDAWRYGVQGWNCEHWARLVATGDPVSYQVAQTWLGVFDIFGVLRRHRGARAHLASHLRDIAVTA